MALEPGFERLVRESEDREARRVWRAMMLARDVETCRALLRGETVPLERLDPAWVKRLGVKRA